jgi:bifunctional non-homologous end joining protein LigD
VHEVKHDGYRLQVHVTAGRVRLYTMNAADWTDRYPRIVDEAARLKLHSRCFEHEAIDCAFDLLKLDGDDMRRLPLSDRKAALRRLLGRTKGGIQYVAHAEMCGEEAFAAACELGIEGIVSNRLTAPYKSGPCKSWIKVRNPRSAAYLRIVDGSY